MSEKKNEVKEIMRKKLDAYFVDRYGYVCVFTKLNLSSEVCKVSFFAWHLLSCNKYVHYAKDTSAYSFFFSFIFVSFGVYSQHSVDRKAKAFYTHSMTEQNCCAK